MGSLPLDCRLLTAIPQARRLSDLARSTGVSPAQLSKSLAALRERFSVVGVFDYSALGLEEHLLLLDYNQSLWERSLPYVTCKAVLRTGKRPEKLLLLLLAPVGRAGEVADILGVSTGALRRVRVFRHRPDASSLISCRDGVLTPLFHSLNDVIGEGVAPSLRAQPLRRVDNIDLWIVAELTRNPFAKLSRLGAARGLKQQVISYHYLSHVQSLHLYNAVVPKLQAAHVGRVLEVKVERGLEEPAAWALASLPLTRFSVAEPGRNLVYVLAYPGEWELQLFKTLSSCSAVLDFRVVGYVVEELREYTVPFGEVVERGRYSLEILYEALYTPSTAGARWQVYEVA
uniref:Lrp/AsnC family transcriptional regulator n=1 Tax=Thermofilum pendens TaxID=2269 RepID=A0A7C3SL23_THEPE